jgi:hypothetical protein
MRMNLNLSDAVRKLYYGAPASRRSTRYKACGGPGAFGKRPGGLWLLADGVGHPQLGYHMQASGRPARSGELYQLIVSGVRRHSGP